MEKRLKRVRGLVINKYPYRESSDVVVLFTAEYGKIKAVAKGRRRPGSRLGAALENFCLSEIVLYLSRDRELQIVKEAQLLDPHAELARNYRLLLGASYISELLERATEVFSPNRALLELALTSLKLIPESDDLKKLLAAFLLKALSHLGHMPVLDRCTVCKSREKLLYFSVEKGGVLCENCWKSAEDSIMLGSKGISELQRILKLPINKLNRFKAETDVLFDLLLKFARYHLEIPDLFARKVDI